MPKIVLIGAGSTVFARNLLGDILSYPELATATLTLYDIDAERLRTSEVVAQRLAQAHGAHPIIEATTDRRAALAGADYAIAMIQVAGYRPGTVVDFEIPRKYGLRQTIADTLGIGGILRALRTIPVLLDIAHEMEELCPAVTFLNYVNPMAMNCWALQQETRIKTVGLCHGTLSTIDKLVRDLGVPKNEIHFRAAGINHMAFFLTLEQRTPQGTRDLYPLIRERAAAGRVPANNRVRYQIARDLGYFVTESSEHFAEYVPWFIKRDRPDLIERFNIPLDEYPRRCEAQIAEWELLRAQLEGGQAALPAGRSDEYAAPIIHSLETGVPCVIQGNVLNHGLIDNLLPGCCVEVPCLIDRNGIQPTRIGALPPQLAAVIQTNVNVQALTVQAALTHRREHIYHAAMLDPHTAAELDIDQIPRTRG